MDTINNLSANPLGLLAVACLVGVAVVANLALLAMLRGGAPAPGLLRRMINSLQAEAIIWRRSVAGGQEAQRRQSAQMDELHRLVSELPKRPDDPDSPAR